MQEKTCEKKIYIQKVTPPKPLIPLWGVRVFGGSQDLDPYPYPPYPRVKPLGFFKPLINTICGWVNSTLPLLVHISFLPNMSFIIWLARSFLHSVWALLLLVFLHRWAATCKMSAVPMLTGPLTRLIGRVSRVIHSTSKALWSPGLQLNKSRLLCCQRRWNTMWWHMLSRKPSGFVLSLKLVFGSPVRSGLLTLPGMDRDETGLPN